MPYIGLHTMNLYLVSQLLGPLIWTQLIGLPPHCHPPSPIFQRLINSPAHPPLEKNGDGLRVPYLIGPELISPSAHWSPSSLVSFNISPLQWL